MEKEATITQSSCSKVAHCSRNKTRTHRRHKSRSPHTNPAAFQLRYCYTTAGVLEALDAGSIDVGQFAISNSRGGAVAETMAVIGQHQFQVIEQYDAQIEHALMIHPSVTLDDITQIMTHPQVAMQCRETLQQRYPQLAITTGEGDLIDHAAVAAALHSGTIPPTTAVMGPETLADLYTLYIVDRRLNDDPTNTTSFVLVTK